MFICNIIYHDVIQVFKKIKLITNTANMAYQITYKLYLIVVKFKYAGINKKHILDFKSF